MTEVYTEIFYKDYQEMIDSSAEITIENLDILQVCSILYFSTIFAGKIYDETFFISREEYNHEVCSAIMPLTNCVFFRYPVQYKEKNIDEKTGENTLPNMVFLPKYTQIEKRKFVLSLFNAVRSGAWPEHWFNQLYLAWEKIYILDSFLIYSWYADRFKIPISNSIFDFRDIANIAFNKYSLSEFTYIAWYVSRDTAAFIREKGIRSEEKIYKILLTKYNKYLDAAEKKSWQVKKFDRIEGMPDILISYIFHHEILKHGILEGFKTKPYKIMKSDILSRGVITDENDWIEKLNNASSLNISLHLKLIPAIMGGQYEQKSSCSPCWPALSALEQKGLNLPVEIVITDTLSDGSVSESTQIITYDKVLHSSEVNFEDFFSKAKLTQLKEDVNKILKKSKNYLLNTIESISL